MHDRKIGVNDLNRLRIWWNQSRKATGTRIFGSFKLCGEGGYPKIFLLAGQAALDKSSDSLVLRGCIKASDLYTSVLVSRRFETRCLPLLQEGDRLYTSYVEALTAA